MHPDPTLQWMNRIAFGCLLGVLMILAWLSLGSATQITKTLLSMLAHYMVC